MKKQFCLPVLLLLFLFSKAQNKTYYISLSGSDANNGTSQATPWQTLEKLNSMELEPGDQILLQGGQVFNGTINLTAADSGSPDNPVTITSYGTERAMIYSNATALHALNAGGIKITNLVFKGNNSDHHGLYFLITRSDSDLDYIYIDNVEVSEFGNRGIAIGADGTDKGFNHVTVLRSKFHHNGVAGLETFGHFPIFSHTDLTIAYCKFFDNLGTLNTLAPSGNGLIVSGFDGGLVEYCESYNNGGITGVPVEDR